MLGVLLLLVAPLLMASLVVSPLASAVASSPTAEATADNKSRGTSAERGRAARQGERVRRRAHKNTTTLVRWADVLTGRGSRPGRQEAKEKQENDSDSEQLSKRGCTVH